MRGGRRKFTLLLIPHSGKEIASIELSIIFLFGITLLFAGVGTCAVFFSYKYFSLQAKVSESEDHLRKEDDRLRSISHHLQKTADAGAEFSAELGKTAELLSIPRYEGIQKKKRGDFSQFLYSNEEYAEGDTPESLLHVSQQLERSIPILRDINETLAREQRLMKDLPVYWPVPGSVVSMEWGPNIHPVFGSWYIHKGMDLAALPGTPIYAAAEGIVTKTEYDPGYGLHVYVSHKYGFKTHYSHMSAIRVKKGERVVQGQRIGNVGSTGLATGPHLDFQVYLGAELVDPGLYLRTFHSYARPKGNR